MALSNAAMVIAANALRAAMTHAQLHTGAPGATGTSNVATSGRQAVSWNAATGAGTFDLVGSVLFTGGTPSGACTYVSFWSAASGGTFLGSYALTGDQTFNAAGEYTLTETTITGSAT